MSVTRLSRRIGLWRRKRNRWPLTRQIATLFTAMMIANAIIISTALEFWGQYLVQAALKDMSPAAQRAYNQVDNGDTPPTAADLDVLTKELQPIEDQLNADMDVALYGMIVLAGMITMAFGYLMLGRVGRGLGSVAMAARQISQGNLQARAEPAGFASREESQLLGDFNAMAAALQRAERELAESSASIAHELRTPLTILRGRLHGIADGVFALAPQEIDVLLYQVEGLGRLVDDLQTLTLANSQRLLLVPEPADLADEVRRVMAAMDLDIKAAGLEPTLVLAATRLVADGLRIRQAISAVVANACRHAANSGVLRISTYVELDSVVLEVIDHGPGLPTDEAGRAFDRFWRGEHSRSRNTGGTGLGLAVVRAIVEAHNGSAVLTNHIGGGTMFQMRLPAATK